MLGARGIVRHPVDNISAKKNAVVLLGLCVAEPDSGSDLTHYPLHYLELRRIDLGYVISQFCSVSPKGSDVFG